MKRIFILAIIFVALSGCASVPKQDEEDLSEAHKQMLAAMKACVKEDLSRENAVEQIDCIGNVEMQANYESQYPYMWIVENHILAERASAIDYAEGKIDQETYIKALDRYKAESRRIDKEERAKDLEESIKQSEVHLWDSGMMMKGS